MRLSGDQVAGLERKLKAVETAVDVAPLISDLQLNY
jgi:hypothetical protein